MTLAWRAITVLGLHAGAAVMFGAAAEPAWPPAVPAKTEPAKVKLEDISNIVFYIAKGDANACGHGCDEWIAADGKIDIGAPERLRRLLAKLGSRRLPIFLYSPGGTVNGSLELGRLIRRQKLVTGVARTVPHSCDRDNWSDKTCEALKRSGVQLKSELDTEATMCNSGCVFALIGGTARLVPPWGRLGIHAVGAMPKAGPVSPAVLRATARLANSQIGDFLRDMGIDVALQTVAAATPFESMRMLNRDEFARFGIDTRDFGETNWRYVGKPKPAVIKTFFIRTEKERLVHRSVMLRLNCGSGTAMTFALAREVGPSEPTLATPPPLTAKASGWRFDLVMAASGNIAASDARFDVGSTLLPVSFVDILTSTGDAGTFEIVPKFPLNSTRWPQSVTLTMSGFAAAHSQLRKVCEGPARAGTG